MAPLSQTIGPFIGGVSQAPPSSRPQEFSADLLNTLPRPTLGIEKRPGTRHIARLGDLLTFSGRTVIPFSGANDRRYILVVGGGTARVFDADTGAEMVVQMSGEVRSYLTAALFDGEPFTAAENGNQLYVVNRTRLVNTVEVSGTEQRPWEALITVAAADFATKYTLVIDGQVLSYTTPAAASPNDRAAIATDAIATSLENAFKTKPWSSQFYWLQEGSTVHLRRIDGRAFTLVAYDGLANRGLAVTPGYRLGTVPARDALPPKGIVKGFVASLAGNPETGADDVWMRWTGSAWKEVAAPGYTLMLDPTTMPVLFEIGLGAGEAWTTPNDPPAPVFTNEGANGVRITFDPNAAYHTGWWYSYTVNGVAGAMLTLVDTEGGPASGSGVAEMLYKFGSPPPGMVLEPVPDVPNAAVLRPTDPGAGRPTISAGFYLTGGNTFAIATYPKYDLTTSSLVGMRLENVTRGYSAWISGNDDGLIFLYYENHDSPARFAYPGDQVRVAGAPNNFIVRRPRWSAMDAGSRHSNPPPSFVGKTLTNASVVSGRLLLTAGEHLTLSAAGDHGRFFRSSASGVRDDDPIDIRSATGAGQPFRHVTKWNGIALLHLDRGILALRGEPSLTPRTVSLNPIHDAASSGRVRPVVAGRNLLVVRRVGGSTAVTALAPLPNGAGLEGADLTADVPTFLKGRANYLAADASGLVVVATDAGLYAGRSVPVGRGEVMAWTRWTMPGVTGLHAVVSYNGAITFVTTRSDGINLEVLDTLGDVPCLDRLASPAKQVGPFLTKLNAPYTGLEPLYVVRTDTMQAVPATQTGAGEVHVNGDYGNIPVVVGVGYPMEATPSTIYPVADGGGFDLRNPLTITRVSALLDGPGALGCELEALGRNPLWITPRTRKLLVPVLAKSEQITLTFISTSPLAVRLGSLEWDGQFTVQSNRRTPP
jgi:hypothetical protein